MPLQPIKRLDDDVPAGTCLGPYEVVGPLGAGGMARVYRALDRRLRREVAIKTLDGQSAGDPRRRRRFDREAQAASVVSHPHVLMVLDVGEWEGRPYIVHELLEGRPLRALLRPGLLSVRQSVDYAIQLCRGLQAIHERGIVHHDLKPENVFVTTDGWVKILDLGLAGPSPGEDAEWLHTTEDSARGGTTAYMAPEQVRRQPTDPRTDLFAVGVMLYEMLGRRRPFVEETAAETMTAILRREPTPLEQIDPALPPSLVRVVDRCLRKRAEDRFHSAHDLSLALEAAFADAPRAAGVAPSTGAPRPRDARGPGDLPAGARSRRGMVAASVAAVVGLVLAANVWLPRRGLGSKQAIVFAGTENPTLVRYDATKGRFAPFLAGSIDGIDTSRDGRWIAYTTYPAGELWRANRDGSEPRRLTSAPLRACLPRWSPDGTRIAFAGHVPDRPWQVHIVPSDGGPIEVLAPENVTDPGWRPDGRALLIGTLSNVPGPIFEWELDSGRQTIVPGSHGLFSPRPSPDGRYLAALDVKTWQVAIRDQATGAWSRYGSSGAAYPAWTRDGSWLHFRRDAAFSRIDPASGREEPIAALQGAIPVGGEFGSWSGLTPDGSPVALVTIDPTGD